MNRIVKYGFLLIILVSVSFGCSTKKNTSLTRFYHGLTTKYNVLFNGSESYKEGVKKYESEYIDDYSQVLPVFIYGDDELAASIKPQMDRTIEKSTKSIKLHSITKKPDQSSGPMSESDKAFYSKNEYNRYIDDSYLIMGKAFFYQADYESAIRTFDYIIKQYDDKKTKYLAYNWLIRSQVQKKDFREAKNLIDFVHTDIDYPEKLNYQFLLTQVDFNLKQQRFSEAEPLIAEALALVKRKKEKTRLTFINAQIKEELKKHKESSDLYEDVIKMNPSYEMSFNAKIKRATLFTGGKSAKSIKSELLDMLKDNKNVDFLDQVYYAMAELEMKNNNVNQAIEYYQLSANSSKTNTNQKAITYLALANIHFSRANYTESQAYFDSAVVSLDPNFPGYSELSIKNQYLSKLVKNLKEIKHQDSLLMVAKMPEKDRDLFIQNIIQGLKIKESEEIQREREKESAEMAGLNMNAVRPSTSIDESGKWYFYSPSAKSFGVPEFKRRWGTRKLEDNWRRKSKQIAGIEQITETEFSDEIMDKKQGLDSKSSEFYLVELPLTDSAKQESQKKIQRAYYNAAEVYKNDLKDYPLAIETYKELVNRYPESEYKVPAYYGLYKVYQIQNDIDQSDVYKNMIIRSYPESKYAKVLVDPNYFKQFENEEIERKEHYIATLLLYHQKSFADVVQRCSFALGKDSKSEYTPKYRYLRALSLGELNGISVLRVELEKVKNEFRDDPVAKSSEDLLAWIQKNELKNLRDISSTQKADTVKQVAISNIVSQKTIEEIEKIYTYNPSIKHYFAVLISKGADINQLKFNLINYNLDFDIEKSYEVESSEFNQFFTIVTVKEFENALKVDNYYKKISSESEKVFSDVKSTDYQYFYISESNLISLAKEQVVRDYLIFYKKYYQK